MAFEHAAVQKPHVLGAEAVAGEAVGIDVVGVRRRQIQGDLLVCDLLVQAVSPEAGAVEDNPVCHRGEEQRVQEARQTLRREDDGAGKLFAHGDLVKLGHGVAQMLAKARLLQKGLVQIGKGQADKVDAGGVLAVVCGKLHLQLVIAAELFKGGAVGVAVEYVPTHMSGHGQAQTDQRVFAANTA